MCADREVGTRRASPSLDDILTRLEALSNPQAAEGMVRYGITGAKVYGVSVPNLRTMAKEIRRDHDLALQLWAVSSRETRILASMVADPRSVTDELMEAWVQDFDSWEVCDQCCMNLFKKTAFAYPKAVAWSSRDEEFVKRAGFVLMACLAVSDKKAVDEQFAAFFPLMLREAHDGRNYVKKAVNWALRQIGKRNPRLNQQAIKMARQMQQMDSPSAPWIAADALRELTSDAVQKRWI
mgnify:CR=1 FL=1